MIDTLYVNGCSWMEGYMLHEEQHVIEYAKSNGFEFEGMWNIKKNGEPLPHTSFKEIYNKFNLSHHLAKELNIPNVRNDAEGAGSNYRIVRTTIDYVKQLTTKQKESTLVIIGWSLIDRNELFLDDKQGHSAWCKFNVAQRFSELDPRDLDPVFVKSIDKFWEHYVVDIHSYYYSIKKFFEQSYLLANLLENNNIKYYFYNTFSPLWGSEKILENNQDLILEFKNDVEFYNSNIVSSDLLDTFSNFIDDIPDCHLSDRHPNSKGYRLWADHILADMKQKGIV